MSRKIRSLKLNAAVNLLKVMAGMIFPLITFPYTSRVLGPEGTGKLNFANSFVAYFVLLASIGLSLYGTREVAKVRDDEEKLRSLAQELLTLHAGAVLVSLALYLPVVFLNGRTSTELGLFLIVSSSIPLSLFALDWLYQGLEEYVYITVRSLAFTAGAIVAMFAFVHGPDDYIVNAVITLVATVGSSVLNFWNARSIVFGRHCGAWELRRHLRPMMTVYVLNLVTSLYINLDTVMLGFLSTDRSVGLYSSAMKLTKMLLMVVISFGGVLLPRLSWYLANDRRDEFDLMLRKSLAVVLLLCLPITVSLIILNREILLLFAGPAYLEAAACLVITAPIILFIGLTNILGMQILYPLGRERDVLVSVGVGAIIALTLNAALIPRLAHVGAAWGALIAECMVLAVQLFMVRRSYSVAWPWASIRRYIAATVAMALCLLLIRGAVPESRLWLRLILEIPIGTAIYFLMLILLKEELLGGIHGVMKGRFGRG